MKPYNRLYRSTYAKILCFLLIGLGETIAFTQHAQVRVKNPQITRINFRAPVSRAVYVPQRYLPNFTAKNLLSKSADSPKSDLNHRVSSILKESFDHDSTKRQNVLLERKSGGMTTFSEPKPSTSEESYEVKSGDTISGVVKKNYGKVKDDLICKVVVRNGLPNPDILKPGQNLFLPQEQDLKNHIPIPPEVLYEAAYLSAFRSSNKTNSKYEQYKATAAKILAENADAKIVMTVNIQGDLTVFGDDGRALSGASAKSFWVEQLSNELPPTTVARLTQAIEAGRKGTATDDFIYIVFSDGTVEAFASKIPSARPSAEALFIGKALDQGMTDEEIRSNLTLESPVVVFERMPDNGIAVLEKNADGDGYTLYVRNDSWRTTEIFSLTEFDHFVRDNIIKPVSTAELPFLHAAIEGKDAVFQLGSMTKRIPREEITRLLENPNIPQSPLDELIASSSAKKIVVYRDPLYRRPKNRGGPLKTATEADPEQIVPKFNERYRNLGKAFYLGNDVVLAKDNTPAIRPIEGHGELAMVNADSRPGIADYGVAKNLKKRLSDCGVTIIAIDQQGEKVKGNIAGIIVAWFHMTPQVEDLLEELGKLGLLKDCTLFAEVCYLPSNTDFFSRLIKLYGLRLVVGHITKIGPVEVQETYNQLPMIQFRNEDPMILYLEMIDRALQNPDLTPTLRSRLEEYKKSLLPQTSDLQFQSPRNLPRRIALYG